MMGRTSTGDALLLSCGVTAADMDWDLAAVAFEDAFVSACALILRLSCFSVCDSLFPLH